MDGIEIASKPGPACQTQSPAAPVAARRAVKLKVKTAACPVLSASTAAA